MLASSVCTTSFSALRTSLCNLASIVTAATEGISSNIYCCQFLPTVFSLRGTSVDRFEAMIAFCRGSVTRARMRLRNELMASNSCLPLPRAGASITRLEPSRSSLFCKLSGSASLPSASRAMAIRSSPAKLYSESLIRFTSMALSYHGFTFAGLPFMASAKSA